MAAAEAPAGLPELRRADTVVARTMAELGTVCDGCTHPFGRHDFFQGCVALVEAQPPGAGRVRCGCLAKPGRA